MPWILTQANVSSCILRTKKSQSLDQVREDTKDFARLFFCLVWVFLLRSVQMRFDASEANWMYISAELVQMGVQQKCLPPEASLFPVELANTFREKSAVAVHREKRQKTYAKCCEILSHTSPYPASKRSLKDTVLGERANIHSPPPIYDNKLFQGKTWILFDLSHLQIPHFSGVLNFGSECSLPLPRNLLLNADLAFVPIFNQ